MLAASSLGNAFRISRLGSPQRHEIKLSGADRVIDLLEQPHQAPDRDHWHTDRSLHRPGVVHQIPRRMHGEQNISSVVVSGGDVDGIDQWIQHLGECDPLLEREASLIGLFDTHPVHHRTVGTNDFADAVDHLKRESRPVLQRTAILICPPLRLG